MKTMTTPTFNFIAGFVICLFIIIQYSFDKKKNETTQNREKTHQWYAPELPSKMDFAGEPVPLDTWDIRERMDRELLFNYYSQNNVLFILKMSNRYFPVIEERLKARFLD